MRRKLTPDKRKLIEFCFEAHQWTEDKLRAGVLASDVAKGFYNLYEERGFIECFTYGPCHGTGLIEVEAPWMETTSDYKLKENMTFQVDTFVSGPSFGIRWEKGVVIRENSCEHVSPIGKIYEIE